MNKGPKEEEIDRNDEHHFDENDLFNIDIDDQDDENEIDLSEYPSDLNPTGGDNDDDYDNPPSTSGEDEEEEEEEEDSLFDDNEEEESEEEEETDNEFTDEDLAEFNKKFNKDFKSTQDLKDFLNKEDNKEESASEETEYEDSVAAIEYFEDVVALNDEDLMRKQFETIAMKNKKDINDPDVQEEIEDQVQELIDSKTLRLTAKDLRRDIQDKMLNPAIQKKQQIEANRAQREAAQQREAKEELQNAFANIHNSEEGFFGIKTDKKRIQKAYQAVSKGDLLERLKTDRSLAAKVAVILEYEQEVHKKASGRTFSDGIGSVIGNYEKTKDTTTGAIAKAQRKGSSGGADADSLRRGLLA